MVFVYFFSINLFLKYGIHVSIKPQVLYGIIQTVQTELRSKNTCSGEIPRLRCPQHRAKWERHVVQLYNFTLKHDLMCDELMLSHPTMSCK